MRTSIAFIFNQVSQLVAVVVVDGSDITLATVLFSEDGEDDGNDDDGVVGAYPNGEWEARKRLFNVTTQCNNANATINNANHYNK